MAVKRIRRVIPVKMTTKSTRTFAQGPKNLSKLPAGLAAYWARRRRAG